MSDFGRIGGPFSAPGREEGQEQHRRELQDDLDHERLAEELHKAHPRPGPLRRLVRRIFHRPEATG